MRITHPKWFLRVTFATGIIVVVFLLFAKLRAATPLTAVASRALKSPLELLFKLGENAKKAVAVPFHARRLALEVQDLESQLRHFTAENARLLELEGENVELRRELQFFERTELPFTIARIVSRIKEGGANFLVLNRGSDERVAVGDPVIVDGAIIGKIIKVASGLSIAAPMLTSGMKTAATFAGSEKTSGIVEGELNLNLRMSLIPRDVVIAENMVVITSGLEENIPRGFVIGTVAKIESNPQELFQTAYLRPAADAQKVTIVSLIHANEIK